MATFGFTTSKVTHKAELVSQPTGIGFTVSKVSGPFIGPSEESTSVYCLSAVLSVSYGQVEGTYAGARFGRKGLIVPVVVK